MRLRQLLANKSSEALLSLYGKEFPSEKVQVQKTRPEFEGDLTIVVFPFLQISKKSPEQTGNGIGKWLVENVEEITSFNVIKGFLNLVINDNYWINSFNSQFNSEPGIGNPQTILLEYSSPNTNKPLHLGHIRNNLLGFSIASILEANGHKVIKTQIINDRGIHICKSMQAWKGRGRGETPESIGMKGDKFVGKYYVEFEKIYKEEMELSKKLAEQIITSLIKYRDSENITVEDFKNKAIQSISQIFFEIRLYCWKEENQIDFEIPSLDDIWPTDPDFLNKLSEELKKYLYHYLNDLKNRIKNIPLNEINATGLKEEIVKIANDFTPLVYDTHALLRIWEYQHKNGKGDILDLWKMMNGWVYKGFEETYKQLGVSFDRNYYESETYLYGKQIVEQGIKNGIFYKKEDNSVWIDLKNEGMDDKLLIRSDGTTVYMTQDIGTAIKRFEDFPEITQQIYTVGNEQDYHFKVLFTILKKLGYKWADKCYHLSYGMVDLPSGKMKSREGTVVDADDLIDEMIQTAKKTTEELGKLSDIPEEKRNELFRIIGLGALKYFILKVDPKKRMLFNPQESIDFNGNTGPFIQYTYARIQSLLRKANHQSPVTSHQSPVISLNKIEKNVLKLIYDFPDTIKEAGDTYNPAVIANYIYELVKEYNHFYQSIPVLSEPDKNLVSFRLMLSQKTGEVIKSSMKLLGIEVPDKM